MMQMTGLMGSYRCMTLMTPHSKQVYQRSYILITCWMMTIGIGSFDM
jgi:hypothetical protein